jgi:phenylacetate-CoA ligase
MIELLKNITQRVPYPIGSHLAKIPFQYRLGKTYTEYMEMLHESIDVEQYSITHLKRIVRYAVENIPFYRNLYREYGVEDLKITDLSDIKRLPIITKATIREHFDEFSGAYKLNTGGTTGEPFSLYVDKYAYSREWAHMHHIWSMRGYTYTDLKITLRGQSLSKAISRYNPVHNEYMINTYIDASLHKAKLMKLFTKRDIKYIHGYPSAIYTFLSELELVLSREEKNYISNSIKSCLLGSEYPLQYMLKYINEVWGLDYISWYGHSEMCILAHDNTKQGTYQPFPTYGHSEVIDHHLIGTSFHNYDMPLIRYDTGDIVDGESQRSGVLNHFMISEGRVGDFILDKHEKRISLTEVDPKNWTVA